jgi:hypothetical protein
LSHEYTLLLGGTVLRGGGGPDASAIAWAADTVLAIGSDEEVRAISRGDSRMIDLAGATVIPVAETDTPSWPTDAALEVGGKANLAVLRDDPRLEAARPPGSAASPLAVIRAGRVVSGALPPSRPRGVGNGPPPAWDGGHETV